MKVKSGRVKSFENFASAAPGTPGSVSPIHHLHWCSKCRRSSLLRLIYKVVFCFSIRGKWSVGGHHDALLQVDFQSHILRGFHNHSPRLESLDCHLELGLPPYLIYPCS